MDDLESKFERVRRVAARLALIGINGAILYYVWRIFKIYTAQYDREIIRSRGERDANHATLIIIGIALSVAFLTTLGLATIPSLQRIKKIERSAKED